MEPKKKTKEKEKKPDGKRREKRDFFRTEGSA